MYLIYIEENAEKFLKKIEKTEAESILKRIYSIRENPFRFVKRLQGKKLWRLRSGDYRVIIDIIISANKIIVLKIGHRKNIYE